MSKKSSKLDPFYAREAEKYESPIPSREFIIDFLKNRGKPANYKDLVSELQLETEEEQLALHRRLKAMMRDEQLERLGRGRFWPISQRILLEGLVHVEKGKAPKTWVIPKDGTPRILIKSYQKYALFQGNRVVVSTNTVSTEKFREGRIVEVLEQQRMHVTGRLVFESGVCYVIPHGKDINQDIIVPPGKEKEAKEGDIVIVEVDKELSKGRGPVGHIVEVLGHENSAGIEIKSAIRAYELPNEWPKDLLKEIEGLTDAVSPAHKRNRVDLRAYPLITIDGEDSRDFDDAVYCERKRSGWRLIVAIADVSHYVKPHTALDREAQLRGNSVYFPAKVIPMLPEILSNGLCSLNPNVDRLCMICDMTISATGKITKFEFQEGVMRSHARLTYTKVAALIKGESEHLKEQYAHLLPLIKELNELFQALKAERETRGAIEFETVETRILFGQDGKISRIEPTERNDAHRIIEECMLCANVATAHFLKKHKLPGLYRNHEGPQEDKLSDLKIFLSELGLTLGGGKTPKPLDYAMLLRAIQDRPDANVIQTVLLRSLSQAVYSPENVGHFGLAYPAYAHFTSPIRRYPDLLVHRQIRSVLRGKWDPKQAKGEKIEKEVESLESLGIHTSMTERRADDATRDAIRWLKCEYIQKHVGQEYQGVISGVTRFGFFVELKDVYIDGLVHVNNLKDDYYYYDAAHHKLIGERTGTQYRLGDTVQVRVAKVDIPDRKIDFDLIKSFNEKSKKKKAWSKSKKEKHKEHSKERSKKNNQRKRKN